MEGWLFSRSYFSNASRGQLSPFLETLKLVTTRRIIIAGLTSLLCLWAIWQAARIGIARTAADSAQVKMQTSAADLAVRLSPADAETHYARGDVFERSQDYSHAKAEFEQAATLRPRDYYLWLVLGVTRDADQDQEGALRALRQSALLAPSYAKPRWQLGNLLLRMGDLDQAFVELRKAARVDPSTLPVTIDLAWGLSQHDPQKTAALVSPETDSIRLELALFFAKHNEGAAAARQFLSTKEISEAKSEALLDELLRAKLFKDAYQVWARMRDVPATNSGETFFDGGFEGWLAAGQAGFGWQITPSVANVEMSVDTSEHQSGGRSLRLEFRGNSNPGSPLLTQLVLVKPQSHYAINFAALSKDFISAAAPIVTVSDASDPKAAPLAQSPPLMADKSGWRQFTLDLTTGASTHAIVVSVARQTCANDPCPAFGFVWLDSFSIQ
jgi:tetratricopeptide (TPR) repeat protein